MMRALVLAGLLLTMGSAHQVGAQERQRVDLYDKGSRRTGHAIINEEAGRVDFYDSKSRRTGYGKVEEGGRLELFDLKSRRVGEGVPGR